MWSSLRVDAYDGAYMSESEEKTIGIEWGHTVLLVHALHLKGELPLPFFTVSKYVSYHCVAVLLSGGQGIWQADENIDGTQLS